MVEALRAEKPCAHWRAVRDGRSGWVGQVDDVGTDAGPSSTQAFGFVVVSGSLAHGAGEFVLVPKPAGQSANASAVMN